MELHCIIANIIAIIVGIIIYLVIKKIIEACDKKANAETQEFMTRNDILPIRQKEFINVKDKALRKSDIVTVLMFDEAKEISICMRGFNEPIVIKEENENIRHFLYNSILDTIGTSKDLMIDANFATHWGALCRTF